MIILLLGGGIFFLAIRIGPTKRDSDVALADQSAASSIDEEVPKESDGDGAVADKATPDSDNEEAPNESRLSIIGGKPNALWRWRDGSGRSRDLKDLQTLLDAHRQWVESSHKSGRRCDLSHAYLRGAILPDVVLSGANLSHAFLADVDLTRADLEDANLSNANAPIHTDEGVEEYSPLSLEDANLTNANLEGVTLMCAQMDGVQLSGGRLKKADLSSSSLRKADLTGADLTDASLGPYISPATGDDWDGVTLDEADLFGANLKGCLLAKASLVKASILQTNLDSANLHFANLTTAIFEPSSLPELRGIAAAQGLDDLRYEDNPDSLIQLADQFEKGGFSGQRREVTYSLNRARVGELGWHCSGPLFSARPCASYVFQTVFFDATCQYGLAPWRPLLILVLAVFTFSVVYFSLLHVSVRGSLIIVLKRQHSGRQRAVGFQALLRDVSGTLAREFTRARVAVLLSLMSAFSLGFREIDFGRWVRLLLSREYEIRPTGIFRTLAGLQSLFCLYLVALSILAYFGDVFRR